MNKYLEKIAEDDEEKKPVNAFGKLGIGYLGASLGLGASVVTNKPLTRDIIHQSNNEHGISDHGTVKKFMRDNNFNKHNMTLNHRMHITKKLPESFQYLHQNHHSPAELTDPHTGRHILLGMRDKKTGKLRNLDVAMHELGHAKDFRTHTELKHKAQIIGNTKGNHAAMLGVAAMSNEDTRHYAPLVAAVPGAIVLRSEAAANYHAYHGIKAHKGAKAANKFLTRMVPKQMAGYVAGTLGPAAGLYGANKLIDYVHKKRGIDKQAEMSDMEAAREFHHAEEDDVKKYEEAKKTAKNPKLLKAINYALPEEKIHARLFGEALKDEEKSE